MRRVRSVVAVLLGLSLAAVAVSPGLAAEPTPSDAASEASEALEVEGAAPEADETVPDQAPIEGEAQAEAESEADAGAETSEVPEGAAEDEELDDEAPVETEESSVISDGGSSAAAAGEVAGVVMYRLYNPYSGEHFYTGSLDEARSLVMAGWTDEGEGWRAPSSSSSPVYRLYNPYAGDHHYTLSAEERDRLCSVGWRDEGIGWYSDDAKSVALHRQYNPHATVGTHNFTSDENERNALVGAGWRDEGVAWYGLETNGAEPFQGLVTRTQIMGSATADASDMVALFDCLGASFPSNAYSRMGAASIDDFCRILVEESEAEGVNPAVVFAHAMVETDWLRFEGGVGSAQCNFASLGVSGDDPSGTDFSGNGANSVRIGLRAQVQHLKAYATNAPLSQPCVDDGYDAVPKGSAAYVENLGSGTWSAEASYAEDILQVLNACSATFVTNAEKPYVDVYNYDFYRAKYPDIEKAFGSNRGAALEHFLTHGIAEHRQACTNFSIESYYNQYEDLRRGYGTDLLAFVRHYIDHGRAEGRVATGCDSLVGGWQYHNVAWAGQPNSYYCGPTAGYMILRNAGAVRSSIGDALTINNVARYMETDYYGFTSFNNRKFEQGMNNWLGSQVYGTYELPPYSSVRDAVLRSYENGYATAFDAHERRGGPHYNGHNNATFSHIVVVDAFNSDTNEATFVDPGAGTVWWGSSQKFSYSLPSFVSTFVNSPDWGYRDGIGMYYARN